MRATVVFGEGDGDGSQAGEAENDRCQGSLL
jgi:hypothetical protein